MAINVISRTLAKRFLLEPEKTNLKGPQISQNEILGMKSLPGFSQFL